MTAEQIAFARMRTREMLATAGIVLTVEESNRIEIADFGLGRLEEEGLEIITYVNNEPYCAKDLVISAADLSGASASAGGFRSRKDRDVSRAQGGCAAVCGSVIVLAS
jgi:hypothetical protein